MLKSNTKVTDLSQQCFLQQKRKYILVILKQKTEAASEVMES